MRKLLMPVAAMMLALTLSACGGGDDSSSEGGEPSSIPQSSGSTEAVPGPSGAAPATSATGNAGQEATGATAASNAGDTPHACTLLTAEEVNEALGGDVDVEEGRDYLAVSANATNCEWSFPAGAVYVEVLGEGAKSWFDAVHFGQEFEAVDGVGDEATWSDLGVLDVLDGDYMVSIQIVAFSSTIDDQEAARNIAEKVLGKLP